MILNMAVCDDESAVCEYLRDRIADLLAKWDIDGRITVFNDGEPLASAFEAGQAGIEPERMAVEAFGQFSNKYSNKTAAGRALNRKVVIAISRYAMERKPEQEVTSMPQNNSAQTGEVSGKAGSSDIEVVRGEGNSIELNFNQK